MAKPNLALDPEQLVNQDEVERHVNYLENKIQRLEKVAEAARDFINDKDYHEAFHGCGSRKWDRLESALAELEE